MEERQTDVDHWAEFGQWLRRVREHRGFSIRRAAEVAGISEASWRQYEQGGRPVGDTWLPPNPTDVSLRLIAHALDLDPADVFRRASRTYEAPPPEIVEPNHHGPSADPSRIVERLDRIEELVTDLARKLDQLDTPRGGEPGER